MVLAQANRGEAGLSLVEALVAVGLLFIIAMGIIPLFSRAILNNALSNDGTRMANFAREIGEYGAGSNFDDPLFELLPGELLLEVRQEWVSDRLSTDSEERAAYEGRWYLEDEAPADQMRFFRRTVETRQFGIGQWEWGKAFEPASSLPSGSPLGSVQLKLIEIEVRGEAVVGEAGGSSILGAQRPTRVTLLKAF